jgi:hypothetical protein
VLAARTTVDVIIADMPRPRYDIEPVDVLPSIKPPRKAMAVSVKTEVKVTDNGAKTNGNKPFDPRPKD